MNNEIILIGEVTSRIISSTKNKISTIYLKVYDEIYNKVDYIPICFRGMDRDFLLSLKGKEIGISGHIEPRTFNRIFVDVIQVVNN